MPDKHEKTLTKQQEDNIDQVIFRVNRFTWIGEL
jgi:hypothetical protein